MLIPSEFHFRLNSKRKQQSQQPREMPKLLSSSLKQLVSIFSDIIDKIPTMQTATLSAPLKIARVRTSVPPILQFKLE